MAASLTRPVEPPNKRLKLAGGDRFKGNGVLCAGAHELSFNDKVPCGRVARSQALPVRSAAPRRGPQLPVFEILRTARCCVTGFATLLALTSCSSSTSPTPRPIPNVMFAALSAGDGFTCGSTAMGAAYCWGANDHGELGDGGTSGSDTLVLVAGGLAFRSVTAGAIHMCGLVTTGGAYCWGDNFYGQLGDTLTDTRIPGPVAGGLSFTVLSAGGTHTCGVQASGVAYCWGMRSYGQVGDSTFSIDPSVTPVRVVGGLTFATISAGTVHTCGVTTAGAAYCWGNNEFGRLGDNSTQGRSAPVPVAGGLSFAAISAGNEFTCGVTIGGALYCWGRRPGTSSMDSTPVATAAGQTFASLSSSDTHACTLTSTGAAYCWGLNPAGQLGDGTFRDDSIPVAVSGAHSFTSVACGYDNTCALTAGGTTYCWGHLFGSVKSSAPVRVSGPP
jgi:alpha-tubulin suppressor-like RCC1 family protein